MARVSSFMLCDLIQRIPTAGGSVSQLVSPQIVIRPQFIPGNFSFGFAAGISDIDFSVSNKLKFRILSPDGTVLQDSGEKEIPMEPDDDSLPKEMRGVMACIDVRNLLLTDTGIYNVEFYVNGEMIGRNEIPVYRKNDTK